MKQNLTRKQVIFRFFSVTGITGLIFSVGRRFWGLGPGPPPNQNVSDF